MQISLWRRVAGHPRMVFGKVADIAHWPQMVRSITNVAILDLGPIREGTRIIETRFMYGREVTEELLVTDFKPPHRLRVAVHTTTLLCERDHLVDAMAAGGSRLSLVFRARPTSLTHKGVLPFMAPFLEVKLRDELERDLEDFVTAVHSQ
jgi:hypothetical protein